MINSLDLPNMGTTSTKQSAEAGTPLRLAAQSIGEFSGRYTDWTLWKAKTECAFDGSGFDCILANRDYAHVYATKNKVVYSQLSVTTVGGNSHHLVKRWEGDKDGHSAWIALCE